MAKVVGRDKKVYKKCTCRNCAAKIEYLPKDVKKYEGKDISGGPDGCTWIDCPDCKERVVLSSW